MSNLPSTIKHHDAFNHSPACGFDGVFDWSFTQGCFGAGKITPMDFDGVIERKGNFLLFETKGLGVPIPKGQMITLESAYRLDCFTIVMIEGKSIVEKAMVWCQPGFSNSRKMTEHAMATPARMSQFCASWFEYANSHPNKKIDVTFLNRRITHLTDSIFLAREHLSNAVYALGGEIKWNDLQQLPVD